MGNWIINIILGVLVVIAMLTALQLGFNIYFGVYS